MNVLVLGAGMYVTGRSDTGPGTVLASLAQLGRQGSVKRVLIAARNPANAEVVSSNARRINALLKSQLSVAFHRIGGVDLAADVAALCGSDRFDAAIVALPDHLHFTAVSALLDARVPTLCVKPLVPTLAEARELVRRQAAAQVHAAVEFHKRFDESNLYAKRLITEGSLGRLLYMHIAYSQRLSIPTVVFREWAGKTNIFQYLGVHYVDLVHFLTGAMPTRLSAYGTRGTLDDQGITAYDSVHVSLEWTGGTARDPFVTHFDTNWIDPESSSALSDQRLTIVGTRGRLDCDQKHRGIEWVTGERGVAHVNPYFAEFLPDADGVLAFQGYGFRSIAQFIHDVEALRADRITLSFLDIHRPSLKSALVSTAVIEAVNRALEHPPAWRDVDAPR